MAHARPPLKQFVQAFLKNANDCLDSFYLWPASLRALYVFSAALGPVERTPWEPSKNHDPESLSSVIELLRTHGLLDPDSEKDKAIEATMTMARLPHADTSRSAYVLAILATSMIAEGDYLQGIKDAHAAAETRALEAQKQGLVTCCYCGDQWDGCRQCTCGPGELLLEVSL